MSNFVWKNKRETWRFWLGEGHLSGHLWRCFQKALRCRALLESGWHHPMGYRSWWIKRGNRKEPKESPAIPSFWSYDMDSTASPCPPSHDTECSETKRKISCSVSFMLDALLQQCKFWLSGDQAWTSSLEKTNHIQILWLKGLKCGTRRDIPQKARGHPTSPSSA